MNAKNKSTIPGASLASTVKVTPSGMDTGALPTLDIQLSSKTPDTKLHHQH